MNCTPAALLCTCRKYAKIILSHVECGAALALSLQWGYTANPITSLTEKGGGESSRSVQEIPTLLWPIDEVQPQKPS